MDFVIVKDDVSAGLAGDLQDLTLFLRELPSTTFSPSFANLTDHPGEKRCPDGLTLLLPYNVHPSLVF